MSSFERPSQAMEQSFANAQRQWQNVSENWNDEVSQRFEREFWSDWESVLPPTIELLRALEECLDGAERATAED